ncbi:MAG: hypothetical protein N2112_03430 [Gemmataceae bacterium]|nr:hypothetical protein [Gemmataceae bacterium]
MGWLQILILGILLPFIFNREISLGVVICLTLSPEHIFYSQYHRFYTITAFFATLSILMGLLAFSRESIFYLILALATSIIVLFCHTLSACIVGIIFLMTLIDYYFHKPQSGKKFILIAGLGLFLSCLIFFLYLYPLGKSKVIDYNWRGLSPFDALASSISQLSWPIFLSSLLGGGILYYFNRCLFIKVFVVCFAWISMVLLLPQVLTFHSAYVFPMNIGYFILSGITIGVAAQHLTILFRSSFRMVIFLAIITFLPFMNLPALVSYYQNGNRHDFRRAAQWLVENTTENDFLAVLEGDKLEYYQPNLKGRWKKLPRKDYEVWFHNHRSLVGRNYFVFPAGRYGIPSEWKSWVEKNGSIQTTIVARRFDDHDYPIIIVLYRGPD